MKLPDFTLYEPLNRLRRMIGAELGSFASVENGARLTVAELDRLTTVGIDIPLSEVIVLGDGTLAYKDRRVVLYIRDVVRYRRYDSELPRFHVSDCTTLQDMRDKHRYERYVVATRDDGLFAINIKAIDSSRYRSTDERLKVCQNCLTRLSWNGFDKGMAPQTKRNIVGMFTLREFFGRFGKSIILREAIHTADTAPLNDYTPDWPQVAERVKQARGYRCERCGIDLSHSANRRFLQAHHKNGERSNNDPSNIEVLCIADHAEEAHHGHMRGLPDYQEFVRRFRQSHPRR